MEEIVEKLYSEAINAVRTGKLDEWLKDNAILEALEGGGDGSLFEYSALIYASREMEVEFIVEEQVGLRIIRGEDVEAKEFPPDVAIAIIKHFAHANMFR